MSAAVTRVWELVEPALAAAGFELVDVECAGLGSAAATVRVRVDVPDGPVDLAAIHAATKVVDAVLESEDPVEGRYTLEVSSPGVERPLRTPAQFRRFVGATIRLKTAPGVPGERRIEGRLDAADEPADPAAPAAEGDVEAAGVVVAGRKVAYEQIERAHTVFVWGPAPKPGKAGSNVKAGSSAKAGASAKAGSNVKAGPNVKGSRSPKHGGRAGATDGREADEHEVHEVNEVTVP